MTEREEKLETLIAKIEKDYSEVSAVLERLKGEDKVRTATFRQHFGKKMELQHFLSLLKEYGLVEDEA